MSTPDRELPLTATHWGTYRAVVRDGRLTALRGFEEDADPSPIGNGMVDTLDDPCRIPQPMVRKGWLDHGAASDRSKRGAEPFVAVSWKEANRLVAREIERVGREHGNRAIYAGSYGWASAGRFHHAPSQLRRFLNCLGGHTSKRDTYSFAAGEVILPHVIGDLYRLLPYHTSWPSIIEHTDLLIAFGGMALKNGQINAGGAGRHVQRDYMREAADAGVAIVNVSPLRSDVHPDLGSEWLAPRPGTDVAFMLGLAHTLHAEGLHDEAFLARYTVGFERFVPYLTGAEDGVAKDADWAGTIAGIDAETIRTLARRMAAGRTMISLSWSLTRQHHGEQPFWMGVTLAAMLGRIGLPGSGVGFGYSAVNAIGNHTGHLPGAALPVGRNEVADFIPVARITDMLLNPGGTFDYNGRRYTYPDVRIVCVGGRQSLPPPPGSQPHARRRGAGPRPSSSTRRGGTRWRGTPTVVLPCTSPLERDDIAGSPRDGYLFASRRVVEPCCEARDDFAISAASRASWASSPSTPRGETLTNGCATSTSVRPASALSERAIEMPSYEEFLAPWRRVQACRIPNGPWSLLRRSAPIRTPTRWRHRSGRGSENLQRAHRRFSGTDDCRGHPRWYEPW